ncbi:unnamed protein product [Symbiodinium natans]|uniref:Uncharacterized protein n=1 Tax=Symbiodinium natans TaxID=878477 RepID=A0A812KQ95_9DINO|nr:unnamed protein product [Symbiodinium natans]
MSSEKNQGLRDNVLCTAVLENQLVQTASQARRQILRGTSYATQAQGTLAAEANESRFKEIGLFKHGPARTRKLRQAGLQQACLGVGALQNLRCTYIDDSKPPWRELRRSVSSEKNQGLRDNVLCTAVLENQLVQTASQARRQILRGTSYATQVQGTLAAEANESRFKETGLFKHGPARIRKLREAALRCRAACLGVRFLLLRCIYIGDLSLATAQKTRAHARLVLCSHAPRGDACIHVPARQNVKCHGTISEGALSTRATTASDHRCACGRVTDDAAMCRVNHVALPHR